MKLKDIVYIVNNPRNNQTGLYPKKRFMKKSGISLREVLDLKIGRKK